MNWLITKTLGQYASRIYNYIFYTKKAPMREPFKSRQVS